jgi:hypothetical protein
MMGQRGVAMWVCGVVMAALGCVLDGGSSDPSPVSANAATNNAGGDNHTSMSHAAGQVRLGSGEPLYPEYATFEALRDAHAKEATSPEAGLRLWFIAVFQYMSANEAEHKRGKQGMDYLTLQLKGQPNWETLPSQQTFVERLRTKPYIFTSYAKGATPQNGYAIDYQRFELVVERSQQDSGGRGWMLAVRSGGADSARPVYMKQSEQTGLWYVSEFNNLYVDIRKPIDPNAETFK